MDMKDDLLISYLLGEADALDCARIEQWITKNPANRQRLNHFLLILETSKSLGPAYFIDPADSLARLKYKFEHRPRAAATWRLINPYFWMKVAAVLVVVLGIGYLYSTFPRQITSASQNFVRLDTLADGSVVTLNRHSALRYPKQFSGQKREVELLEGEAFFSVTPAPTRPFLIKAGSSIIQVVGTTFNVKRKTDSVEVIVKTGVVKVAAHGKITTVYAGEQILVTPGPSSSAVEQTSDLLYEYYRTHDLVADNTPLWRIVDVLNDTYDVHIVIRDSNLADLTLTTTFKNESLANILKVISKTFRIRIVRQDQQTLFLYQQ